MTHEQSALWQRIRDFQFDAPNASFPLSKRLAREQGWTPAYTAQVIDEYRRFAFLAAEAGHPVTPSKAVDEAWHLHLLYTRNYWEEFCPKVLGRSLHHHPSDGNSESEQMFEDQYEKTLTSYERLFAEPPPSTIWPRQGALEGRKRRFWPFLFLMPFFLAGCSEPMNPLDWYGPDFLRLFFGLALAAWGIAAAVQHLMRFPIEGPAAEEWQLSRDEKAYLNGGASLAIASALAHLSATGKITIDGKTRRITADSKAGGQGALEQAILRKAARPGGSDYATAAYAASSPLDDIRDSLVRQGLWISPERSFAIRTTTLLIAMLPVLLGIAKISVGISRERPVGYLLISCLVAGALNFFFLLPLKRSRYGDQVYEVLRKNLSDARYTARRQPFAAEEIGLSVALFGTGYLAETPYADLRTLVTPPPSSGGSGCGSSGCGGGGCGSGCGGCGS